MGTFYPLAIQKPIVRNFGGKRSKTRGAVVHVDAGAAASLQGWFNNPASGASCHFYVRYDGVVEQYLDADLIAWTQRAGNTTCIGIETQGKGEGQWTAAQLASLVGLLRWLAERYGFPIASMVTSRPAARGIGMHRFGIDPYRVAGGEVWGPYAKACPGNDRVLQFPKVIEMVNGQAVVIPPAAPPAAAPAETEAQRIARMNAGYSVAWIENVQRKLNELGYKLDVDGVRGPATEAAIRTFQDARGLVVDGLPGPATDAELQRQTGLFDPLALQRAVRAAADGVWGPDTEKRFEALRMASKWGRWTFPHGVEFAQGVVGARKDGKWGTNSGLAHDATVKNVQLALGVKPDGIWGPESESAYQRARAALKK